MNTARKGNLGERRVQARLEFLEYLVSQRRHVGGAGDLLAVPFQPLDPDLRLPPLLVEVKTDRAGPFATFRPDDRDAMIVAGLEYNVEPILAWTPDPDLIFWVPWEDWPDQRARRIRNG